MLQFKDKLPELNHFVTNYTNIDYLKWHFSRQLEKLYGDEFSANVDLNKLSNTKIDSLTIETVCKILSPQTEETKVQNLKSKVNELINKASDFGKKVAYQLAKVNRRSNRTSDISLVERSIPVFEALVDSNKRKNRHDYFGQLAYALKDKNEADWEKAEENFNTAILIRGTSEPEYCYEFNRAICKVGIYNNAKEKMPLDENLRELILRDLKYAKSGVGSQFERLINDDIYNRLLSIWLNENRINLQSL